MTDFRFIFIILLSVLSISARAEIGVEYRISPVHGLIKFTYAIMGEAHQSPNMKESFERSTERKAQVLEAIADLQSLDSSLRRGMEFKTTTFEDRADGMEVASFIAQQSIFAGSIEELSERTVGLMPLSDHTKFYAALKKIEPVYKKLIWNQSMTALRRHKAELEKVARRANLNDMFERAKIFYRAEWPKDLKFVIGLYPILYIKGFRNSSSSSSSGAVEEHGVMIGGKDRDLESSFGVIFHELSHSLYGAQGGDFLGQLNGYFTENPSPYQLQAHTWFNEAVATAIGNGWAFEKAKGKPDDSEWYNEPTVNAFGKAIYPLTKTYLNEKKPMDREYVDKIIALFAKALPDSIHKYDSLLNRIVMLSDGKIEREIFSEVHKNFRVQSLSTNAPMTNERAQEMFQEASSARLMLFSDKGTDQLKPYAKLSKYIAKNMDRLKKLKPSSAMSVIEDGRPLILIKMNNKEDFAHALTKLKEKGSINPEGELVE